jgi:hypothetical protein
VPLSSLLRPLRTRETPSRGTPATARACNASHRRRQGPPAGLNPVHDPRPGNPESLPKVGSLAGTGDSSRQFRALASFETAFLSSGVIRSSRVVGVPPTRLRVQGFVFKRTPGRPRCKSLATFPSAMPSADLINHRRQSGRSQAGCRKYANRCRQRVQRNNRQLLCERCGHQVRERLLGRSHPTGAILFRGRRGVGRRSRRLLLALGSRDSTTSLSFCPPGGISRHLSRSRANRSEVARPPCSPRADHRGRFKRWLSRSVILRAHRLRT